MTFQGMNIKEESSWKQRAAVIISSFLGILDLSEGSEGLVLLHVQTWVLPARVCGF